MEAMAMYDFKAKIEDELSFEKGDILYVIDQHCDENWWPALHSSSPSEKKGLIPKNYVQMMPHSWYEGKIKRSEAEEKLRGRNAHEGNFLIRKSESAPEDFSLSVRFRDSVQHFKILRDALGSFFLWVVKFSSINKLVNYHKQASVSRTETIILKEKTEVSQQQQQQPQEQVLQQQPPHEQVTCMYDFKPDDDEELPFSKGDMIEVLEKEIDSWWRGKNMRTGETGLFPINYVKQK
ncbi:growth factor receptor-bound protein 2-like isoform X2 [Pecten maximus]|uniref:growth factor receptor-bound protein 2-like isoform X2 n=1 Tax=Pecten maximus TaxID=6579 RepID=UPI001458BB6B|nr:growth factor receptor-bound protein 2-like isoform X2 [Pecten maximus]